MEYTLRKYQEEGIKVCKEVLSGKSRKALVVAPCGAGKSLYVAKTAKDLDIPIVILQPNKELLLQNFSKFIDYGGEATIYCASLKQKTKKGKSYTIVKGEEKRCDEISKVTFATIGSIKKEVDSLKKMGVKHIIIDEAHSHTKVGSQVRKFLKNLKATHVLALTATPIYLKGGMNGSRLVMINRDFGTIFRNIDHVTQIRELVDNNYWAPFVYKVIQGDDNILKLNSSGSDYTEHSQKEYYKSNKLGEQISEEVINLKKEGRKRILIFVPSIEEAEELYGLIPNSSIVHSNLKREERDFMVESFTNGDIPVAINVNILSTGYDNPEIDAIITARPTSSVALAYQQYGRGCRIHPEKENCKIIDFSGNINRFGRIEDLTFEEIPYYGWGLWNGKGELLTDYPIQATNRPTKESLIASYKEENEKSYNTVSDNILTNNNPVFYFGKYKGKTLNDVMKENKGYLAWLADPETKFEWWGAKGKAFKTALYKALRLPQGEVKKKHSPNSTGGVKSFSETVNLTNIKSIF